MALSHTALSELLDAIRAGGGQDTLRDAMTLVLQELIELEADQVIGAGLSSSRRQTAAWPSGWIQVMTA